MNFNFDKAMAKYNLEAQNFDNADGLYSSNADGMYSQSYYVGQTSNYIGQSADGNTSVSVPVTELNDGNRYYTVVITNTNTSGAAINAVVFGADLYSGSTQPNAGVTVTIAESSHAQVRAESQRSPFWVNGIRYITTTNSQMTSQVPSLIKTSSAGESNTWLFRPLTYRTAYNQITTQIDATGFKFAIDGSTYFQVPVIANETVTMILQIGGRWDASKAVNNQSPFLVAGQQRLVSGVMGGGQGN